MDNKQKIIERIKQANKYAVRNRTEDGRNYITYDGIKIGSQITYFELDDITEGDLRELCRQAGVDVSDIE